MDDNELERKLKIKRVEACLNCQLFTECEDIGRIEKCGDFLEVETKKAMIIVSLDESEKLKTRR